MTMMMMMMMMMMMVAIQGGQHKNKIDYQSRNGRE
jgi:hypothetical protein